MLCSKEISLVGPSSLMHMREKVNGGDANSRSLVSGLIKNSSPHQKIIEVGSSDSELVLSTHSPEVAQEDLVIESPEEQWWANNIKNRKKNLKIEEKKRLWKDLEEIYNSKAVKSGKAKKKVGRRREPKEIEVVSNEEEIIASHNEIFRGSPNLGESLEERARRVWNIGKQVGLKCKAVQKLKKQLSEQ